MRKLWWLVLAGVACAAPPTEPLEVPGVAVEPARKKPVAPPSAPVAPVPPAPLPPVAPEPEPNPWAPWYGCGELGQGCYTVEVVAVDEWTAMAEVATTTPPVFPDGYLSAGYVLELRERSGALAWRVGQGYYWQSVLMNPSTAANPGPGVTGTLHLYMVTLVEGDTVVAFASVTLTQQTP